MKFHFTQFGIIYTKFHGEFKNKELSNCKKFATFYSIMQNLHVES